jgi:UDP-N-acetylglucosamine 2-epimerase (non-hydrolysing)
VTKVMTVVGTRPEIIRLSATIKRLDASVDHVLVHTGQNYDPLLNEVFFADLDLRPPDLLLGVRTDSWAGPRRRWWAERAILAEKPTRCCWATPAPASRR